MREGSRGKEECRSPGRLWAPPSTLGSRTWLGAGDVASSEQNLHVVTLKTLIDVLSKISPLVEKELGVLRSVGRSEPGCHCPRGH